MKFLIASLLCKLITLAESGQEPKVIQGLLRRIYTEKATPLPRGECGYGGANIRCPKGRKCIFEHQLCDGENDCGDSSDERPQNCYSKPVLFHRCSTPRNKHDFQCTNGACLHSSLACDGFKDCSDGSDESAARCPSGPKCQELTPIQRLEADIRRKGDSFPYCLYKCRNDANVTSHSLQMTPLEYLRRVQNGSNDSFSTSTLNSVCGIPELTACESACAQNDCERDLVNTRRRLWKLSFGMAWDWLCVRPPSTGKQTSTGCPGSEGSVPDCRSEAAETISSVCQKCEREEEEDVELECVVGVCRLLCEAQVLKERCPSENPDAVGFRARLLLHAWQHSNLTVCSF